jgi:hydroxymethylpyrimidine pyrophosphatase-like HAD family hydrolase
MRYLALACDYDGTIATHGSVTEHTVAALQRVRASGRKLVLVTGRQLEDLLGVFPDIHLFERVVAENGAVLYRPASREEKVLATPPPEEFCWALRDRNVWPLSIGRVVVATEHPHENDVLDAIRQLGLELQVIFNKGSVMVLPSGVNKATGLVAALTELGLSPHNVVGVGDAENDHAFLRLCECAVAVGNALPMLQEEADYITHGACGAGVEELIEHLVTDDFRSIAPRLTRHHILLGTREGGEEDALPPYGANVLLAGSSGGGKSTFAVGFLERLAERQYQFCVVDPEGDYETLDAAVALGNMQRPPSVDEVLQLLESPENNAVINLVGLPLSDRRGFFHALFPRLQEMRARTGRPHWILVDETHHLLSAAWEPAGMALSQALTNMMFVTVHPRLLAPGVLAAVDVCVAVGQSPGETLHEFSDAVGQSPPEIPTVQTGEEKVLVWRRKTSEGPYWLRPAPSRTQRRRHRRKYAEGEIEPERSFYFRGPEGKLNLRAQNLMLFQQLAEGVDDVTWLYHLRRGDYSRWFRDAIKDETLARIAEALETTSDITAAESRLRIKEAIAERYTAPSDAPTPL